MGEVFGEELGEGKKQHHRDWVAPLLVSILIGVLHKWVVTHFWGSYVVTHPINGWLLEKFAIQGHPVLYRVFISLHDAVVNMVLAVPVAALFLVLPHFNHWRNPLAACLTAIGISLWGSASLSASIGFWFGAITAFGSLLLSFAVLRFMRSSAGGSDPAVSR